MYEWDERKRQLNLAKHGVDFAAMESFEWDSASNSMDHSHVEPRWTAIGYIDQRLYTLVNAEREDFVRIISLRKATPQEQRHYAEA
ncbi:MAG: BrnT family toxin [Gammaproteobacteria bacterium]|nr:BrnT family toxin [Gammaproteobacteria bacterium]